jgi:ABC transport system ATP-binding/permease protein
VVGRDEDADVQVVDPLVSRRHVELRARDDGWDLFDRSRNGLFTGGERCDRLHLDAATAGPVVLTLGAPRDAPEVILTILGSATGNAPPVGPVQQGRFSAVHRLPPPPPAESSRTRPLEPVARPPRLRIGREADNDVVLQDLLVSRHHAELVGDSRSGFELVDLNSPNGTYVDGRRVQRVPVDASSIIGIGHALFHLDGDRLIERIDTGQVGFRAEDLTVTVGSGERRRVLLDRVSFSLEESSLLAVVGPSGAGKSTLLRALTGFRPANEGTVEYSGRDLYSEYDELRQRIGLVPQDDILHPQLTVRRALGFAARLRFPSDVSAAERDARITDVIAELGLAAQAEQSIASLSGGQRKRTSVALELLTRPSLLFLDEPTSGLDPGLDKSVMRTLRELSDGGRTVVVVTHNVANLEVCDRLLLLAPGGSVAFFGPPGEVLRHFFPDDDEGRDFADLFLLLEEEPDAPWAERFRRSPSYLRYVAEPARSARASRAGRLEASALPPPKTTATPPPRQQSSLTQFVILARRYLAVIAADRQYTIFMIALPLVLSLLAHALPGEAGLSVARNLGGSLGAPNSLLLVFVIGAALMGSAASIRELVKEREIYRRERAIGLSRAAYLTSKLVVLAVITGVQALVLGLLGNLGRPGPDAAVVLSDPMLEIVVALAGVTIASMALGLAVSAWIDNADRGMPLLVLLAMLQFILSSALLQIGDRVGLGQLSWLVPARWGFAMGAATTAIPSGHGPPYAVSDPLWDHTASVWFLDAGALLGLTVAFVVVAALLLRRLDPRR